MIVFVFMDRFEIQSEKGYYMKICNAQGCGVCLRCNGEPPFINGYSCGDICRKTVENIMNYLEDGELYRFKDGKLYSVDVWETDIQSEYELDI